jgi:hypothetical protein
MEPAFYLVAYIDLLGQSAEMERMSALPRTEGGRKAVSDAMMRSGTSVLLLRQAFETWAASARAVKSPDFVNMPEDARRDYAQIGAPPLFHIGFSDSFVLSMRLHAVEAPGGPVELARAANGIWSAILALAGISLLALTDGIPLRGRGRCRPWTGHFPERSLRPGALKCV